MNYDIQIMTKNLYRKIEGYSEVPKHVGKILQLLTCLEMCMMCETTYLMDNCPYMRWNAQLNAVLSSSAGCCGFIDFSKAFDNVNRETLFKTLKQFQISSKLLNLIQNMYSKLKCQVRT